MKDIVTRWKWLTCGRCNNMKGFPNFDRKLVHGLTVQESDQS